MTNPTEKNLVLAANEAFYKAFRAQNLQAMNALWWQGNTSLCIHPGSQPLIGWSAIQASWSAIFHHTDSLEIEIEIIQAEVDQGLAYVMVLESILQSYQNRPSKAQSIATNIYQKMAQKWYLVSHHGSPIMR